MKQLLRSKRLAVGLMALAVFALSAVPALALGPTAPTIDVASYGDALLTGLGTAVSAIFPYAGVITAFAIGVGMVKRWLGHRKATGV